MPSSYTYTPPPPGGHTDNSMPYIQTGYNKEFVLRWRSCAQVCWWWWTLLLMVEARIVSVSVRLQYVNFFFLVFVVLLYPAGGERPGRLSRRRFLIFTHPLDVCERYRPLLLHVSAATSMLSCYSGSAERLTKRCLFLFFYVCVSVCGRACCVRACVRVHARVCLFALTNIRRCFSTYVCMYVCGTPGPNSFSSRSAYTPALLIMVFGFCFC